MEMLLNERIPKVTALRTSQPQRGTRLRPIVPARAHDELLLHMQQSFAQGYSDLNVRSCRLASRPAKP